MKTLFYTIFISSSLLSDSLLAQDHDPKPIQDEAELGIDPSKVRFVPPEPPKPAPPMEVKAASVNHLPGRTVTIIRAEPSTLPDVPEPSPKVQDTHVPRPDSARMQYVLPLSVTVYNRKISKVSWTHIPSGASFEAWCDFDWSLVAPMHTIKGKDADYSMFFAPGQVDTSKQSDPFPRSPIPEHPPIPSGGFVLVKGDSNSPGGTEVLESVQDFHDRNKIKLIELRDAREKYQRDAAAWRKANPPKPEDHTIWLKPHRGSRYLHEGNAQPNAQKKEGDR